MRVKKYTKEQFIDTLMSIILKEDGTRRTYREMAETKEILNLTKWSLKSKEHLGSFQRALESINFYEEDIYNEAIKRNIIKDISFREFKNLHSELTNKEIYYYKDGYYVYYHTDEKDNIVYVGKTTGMLCRQNQHILLSKHRKEVYKIFYAKVVNPAIATIYELFYINKFKPKYNYHSIYSDDITIYGIIDLKFEEFIYKERI